MRNLCSVEFHLFGYITIDVVISLMKYIVVYMIFVDAGKFECFLDVTRDFPDDECEHVAAAHISLFLAADVAIFIDHLLTECLYATGMSIAATFYHYQVVARTVGIEREPTLAVFLVALYQRSHTSVTKRKESRRDMVFDELWPM